MERWTNTKTSESFLVKCIYLHVKLINFEILFMLMQQKLSVLVGCYKISMQTLKKFSGFNHFKIT